jgi:hypothetical protein
LARPGHAGIGGEKRIHCGHIFRENAKEVASIERNPLIFRLPEQGSNLRPAD